MSAADKGPETGPDAVPALRVERGKPQPDELAALVAVLLAAGGGAEGGSGDSTRRPYSLWGSRARAARPRLNPGPGAWRGSVAPR